MAIEGLKTTIPYDSGDSDYLRYSGVGEDVQIIAVARSA